MSDKTPMLQDSNYQGGRSTGPRGFRLGSRSEQLADVFDDPSVSEGVLTRRVLAYFVDLCVLGLIMVAAHIAAGIVGFVTFGVFAPLLLLILTVIPFAYHTLTINGGGTPGMRLFRLEVRSIDGGTPELLQVALMVAVFMISVPATGGLVLLFALFNERRRLLHDFLAGTIVVNRMTERLGGTSGSVVDSAGRAVRKSG